MRYFQSQDLSDKVLRSRAPRPMMLEAGALYPESEPEETAGISAYWQLISGRLSTILIATVVVTAIVAVTAFKMQPIYRGTALVEIDNEAPSIQSLSGLAEQGRTEPDQEFLRSQAQVLQSDQLAWRTIEGLKLGKNPAFDPNPLTAEADKHKLQLINRFRAALAVMQVPSSRVIRVQFESPDSQLAADVANALVRNYIEYNFTEKFDATKQAAARMEQQLNQLKRDVENSQQALVDYEREHALADVNEKQNVVEQQLSELSTDLSKAKGDRIAKEALYRQWREDPSEIAAVAQNDLLQKLQEKHADLSDQYTEALHRYGPNFPKVLRLRNQLANSQLQIDKEQQRVSSKAGDDYKAALSREKLLSQEVARQKQEVAKVNSLLVQQNILAGEFESNQKMYKALQQRLKDAAISAGLRTANIHLIDPALPPIKPVRPKKLTYISLAVLVGLVLGVSMVLVQNGLDSSVKTVAQAEILVGAPALATVPIAETGGERLLAKVNFMHLNDPTPDDAPVALAALNAPTSSLAESFRGLRTSFLNCVQHKFRVILVTSPGGAEGKSSTAMNLALTLGQRGRSVLLIDCDLRKPAIAPMLGLDWRKGVTTILAGGNIEDAIQTYRSLPLLSVITSGPVGTDSMELLSPERVHPVLLELRRRFDHIIIDSPPVLAAADVGELASVVDGVVLVVAAEETSKQAINGARRVLDLARARVVGVVLNKINPRHGQYSGYYGYYAQQDYDGNSPAKRPL